MRFTRRKSFFFQVSRTPPEETRRRQRALESRANDEVAGTLSLVPFCSFPRVSFDNVKLGKSAIRRIVMQNPGKKPLQVRKDTYYLIGFFIRFFFVFML